MNIVNIIGIFFSILSVLLAIYFYKNRKAKRRIDFIWNHNILQRRHHDDVKFFYEGSEINSLAQLTVLILNAGEREIRSEDTPNGFLIEILAAKKIFSTPIVFTSSESIQIEAEKESENSVRVAFNYLNENEGAIIEILYDHDGTDHHNEDGYTYFKVSGDLVGGEQPRDVNHHNYGLFSNSIGDIISRVLVIGVFIGLDIWLFSMQKYGWCVYFTLAILLGCIQFFREFPSIQGKRFPKFAKSFFDRS